MFLYLILIIYVRFLCLFFIFYPNHICTGSLSITTKQFRGRSRWLLQGPQYELDQGSDCRRRQLLHVRPHQGHTAAVRTVGQQQQQQLIQPAADGSRVFGHRSGRSRTGTTSTNARLAYAICCTRDWWPDEDTDDTYGRSVWRIWRCRARSQADGGGMLYILLFDIVIFFCDGSIWIHMSYVYCICARHTIRVMFTMRPTHTDNKPLFRNFYQIKYILTTYTLHTHAHTHNTVNGNIQICPRPTELYP